MDLEKFYQAMTRQGVLEHFQSPALDFHRELWKMQHLLAMAQLASERDPAIEIDGRLGPRELFRALGGVIDLDASVVLNLVELLLVLESIDPKHTKRPGYLKTAADRTGYRALLDLALLKAEERFPWRAGLPRPGSRAGTGSLARRTRTRGRSTTIS